MCIGLLMLMERANHFIFFLDAVYWFLCCVGVCAYVVRQTSHAFHVFYIFSSCDRVGSTFGKTSTHKM